MSLFQEVLDSGRIPSTWRQGIITNLSKPGDPTDCGNYRGITLLPAIDKLFMKVLASRILNFVHLHDHQYGFVRNKGTTEALFNLIATLEQRKLENKATYAFFLDVKKAFDSVDQNMLLIKLHKAGVRGKVWRVIKACYEQARSRVMMEGSYSHFFDIDQGVAQGCPLSPVLFIIFMDDLLHKLHTECAEHGLTVSFDERPYVGQSFADDTSTLSDGQKHENMQKVIDTMRTHSQDWLWNANVLKSHMLAMQLSDETPINKEAFKWGESDLPFAHKSKNLGVTITDTVSWTEHIAQVKQNGWYKLKRYKQILQNPRVHLRAKLQVIQTKLIPTLTYAMEVWTPTNKEEESAVHDLTKIIDRALALAVLGFKGNNWQTRRCLKMPVIRVLLGIPSATTLLETAHARFADKLDAEQKEGYEVAPLTLAVAQSLAPQHPWRKMVTNVRQQVGQWQDAQPNAAGAPPAEAKPSVKDALLSVKAAEIFQTLTNTATSSHRHSTRRKGADSQAKADPYKHILMQDNEDSMRATVKALQAQGSDKCAPILAACCGHRIDDTCGVEDEDMCHRCNHPFTQDRYANRQAAQWDRLWHCLAGCPADEAQLESLAVYQANLLTAAADSPQYQTHLHNTFTTIQQSEKDPVAAQQTLLHLVTDPAGFGHPPESLHDAIVRLTAEFLSPGHPGAVEPKMSSKQDSESRPVKKTQRDRRVKPYTRAEQEKKRNGKCRQEKACEHETEESRTSWQEEARAEQRFAQCNDSCEEARGGRLKTPPAVPPLVAPAVDPWGSTAMRPMPDRVV